MSTNSFKIKNSAVLTPKDLSTLVTPEAGEIACDINDSNKIKRYDAASSSWVEVGSGGVGSVDIMFVQDFESASLSSFTQTGLSLSTTNPLHGKVSALLTHQAAINQSFKQIVAVDPKFRGQAMVLDLNVKSAASAGNVVIKVRDESNSSDLIVSEALQLSNDVSGRRSSVSFTIPSTCSSLSYTITALPEAGSPVTRIDDIVAMLSDVSLLETSVVTPNMTAWQGYTPTFQGFGTPSNVEFEWRQVGENVEIRGKFTSGTTTAVEARIGLPGGLTSAGTSLIPSLQTVGLMARDVNTSSPFSILIEPSVSYVTLGLYVGNSPLQKRQATELFSTSGITASFFASVPCAGLSATSTKTIPLTQSGLITQPDENYQLNGFTYRTASTNTNILFFNDGTIANNNLSTISIDNNSVLGSTFTIQRDGFYSFNFQAELGGTAGDVYLVKNSTTAVSANILSGFYENGAQFINSFAWSGPLKQGDVLRIIRSGVVATFAADVRNYLSISYVGNVKQVSVNPNSKITIPTSELRFEGASSRGSTATSIVKFDTMAKLRGDAFTVESDSVLGTRITMKKAGRISISGTLYANASAQEFNLTRNKASLITSAGSASEMLSTAYSTATQLIAPLSWTGDVAIGDTFRVSSGGNPNAGVYNSLNLAFQEQDISVSVTNTLPQFSESDSSVRVNTANGYGSTASNKIRRFSSVVDNIGTDISYVDDPANGATFTVLTSGVYNVTYTDQFSAQCLMGLSKNASSLTSAIQSLSASQILATTNSVSLNQPESVSWQGYLSAGDIIRPHSEGTSAGTTTSAVNFTISKVGKPNVTGVDVTPFVNVPQPDIQEIQSTTLTSTWGSTNTLVPVITINKNTNNGILSVVSSAATGTSFVALKKCTVNAGASFLDNASAGGHGLLSLNNTIIMWSIISSANNYSSVNASIIMQPGDVLTFQRSNTTVDSLATCAITATALSDQILTAPESFSTDTASLSYKSSSEYTLSTLQNAPVGSYITFTYAINTNTRTQTTTRPTQTDADMNVNGIQLFTRAYNAASTAAQPAVIAIQIGKGLKGKSLDLYKSAGKVTSGQLDFYSLGSTNEYGVIYKDYNEITGILIIDIGAAFNGASNTIKRLLFSDITEATSGYFVINASKSPALTGVPLLQPRIATLSDVKASGTASGSSSTTWASRILNTINDYSGVISNSSSFIGTGGTNTQFILSPGTYYIEASSPFGGNAGSGRARIFNVTSSSVALQGQGSSVHDPGGTSVTQSTSLIYGAIEINTTSTFELQHRTSSVGTLGRATNLDLEVYAIVKITKVK